jgi:hypothetical protein
MHAEGGEEIYGEYVRAADDAGTEQPPVGRYFSEELAAYAVITVDNGDPTVQIGLNPAERMQRQDRGSGSPAA